MERRDHGQIPTVDEAVRARRSTRSYADRDVPDALIGEILDLARHAPSSMGLDPWCFVVVRSPETRGRLAALKNDYCLPEKRADYPADFVAEAPVVVAVCVDRERSAQRPLENGVLAAAFLLLAAQARGLGGVYMTAYHPEDPGLAEAIRSTLRLPAHVEPVALLPLGFPAERQAPRQRGPLAQHVYHEAFGNPAPA
jgi:nitroreductase